MSTAWLRLPDEIYARSFAIIRAVVPCAMAIFPQHASVRLSALEPDLGGAGWDRDSLVYYNKGL